MNKIGKYLFILMLMLTFGCNAIANPENLSPTQGDSTMESDQPVESSVLVKSELARELSPQVDPDALLQIAKDNTAFAFSFYDQYDHSQENIIFGLQFSQAPDSLLWHQ